jgi:exopolyphosphatase/guanosine-5'-triphosphate,3'-diphosphate pyrophosphatase
MSPATVKVDAPDASAEQPIVRAVMDVGATAIRVTIAELTSGGAIRVVESLQKAVTLGRDVFSKGVISQDTIRQCVNVVAGFARVCAEYGIQDPSHIRAVATSAVREAENRDTFLDRVYIATGISVRVIDEAEESRLMFMALHDLLTAAPDLKTGPTLVADIGAGTTEVLLIENGHVSFSNVYRMGSLRMRQALETHRTPTTRVATILGQQIERAVEQIVKSVPVPTLAGLLVTSGEMQMAAQRLAPEEKDAAFWKIPYKSLQSFLEKILAVPAERLVAQHQIPYPEAETMGPGLLAVAHMARAFRMETLWVTRACLRDGLLREMAARGYWTPAFAQEVVTSALSLAAKYHTEPRHARHVADLALAFFDALRTEHRLSDRHRVLLEASALLHEIGGYVSSRSHHKHSMYLILHSDLFGLTHEDLTLVAMTARYHRRAIPKPTHVEYMALSRDDRIAVAKMAALLRVADALDRNHSQQVRNIRIQREEDRVVVLVPEADDLTVERLAVKEKGDLFEQVFGLAVELREARGAAENETP